jgi:uncharacterized protein (DUF427 family)
MRIPGPDHPITIEHNSNRVRVTFNGRIIADTTRALTLREATFPPVQYIPRQDVDMTALRRTSHSTQCPYKGDASYFSILVEDRSAENAAWSYESPYPSAADVRDYVAFYPSRVDAIEEMPS